MKNIHIPKKFFIALLIFAIVMMLIGLFTSCSSEPYKADVVQDNERFQVVYPQNSNGKYIYIIIDKETNVKYLFVTHGYAGGLTKLEE